MISLNLKREAQNIHKKGFTLAEVLITLGIIGVVAAMTIPTLMTNLKAKQYTTKYKKAVSTLSNAARMSMAQYDFDYSGLDTTCNSNSGTDHPETTHSICALLNGTLTGATYYWGRDNFPEYKIQSKFINETWSLGYGSMTAKMPIYLLPDGTILMLSKSIGEHPCSTRTTTFIKEDGEKNGTACYGIIDVNGFALPNKETTCTKGSNRNLVENAGDCIVNRKDVHDIFPILFRDGIVEPVTSAGWFVLEQNY